MNNRDRKTDPKSTVLIGIIAIIMLLANAATSADFIGIVAVVVFIGILGFAVAFALTKKKGAKVGSVYHSERSKEAAKRIFMREEMAQNEQLVKCTHPRGKDKYIHQLDGFLANGLIDKNEYRILKDRYDKVVIPENMH